MTIDRTVCEAMDRNDNLAHVRDRFLVPEPLIYLDGNSLGALPARTPARLAQVVTEEWGRGLIGSWNTYHWIELPVQLGARIAPLIGAQEDEVVVADSTSVNLFKLAAAALSAQAPRRVILSERGNFPTDLYVLQGLAALLGDKVSLRLVDRGNICASLADDVALVVLTHIHYKTGTLHEMQLLTKAAHAAGAMILWDLSHSAGAIELFLDRDEVDLAIGCGYKYLNGGPGAPAFLYVARRHQDVLHQPLSGWMGHAAPFEFDDLYRPAPGVVRHLCGTPPILGMTGLAEGLATFTGVAMRDVREKSKSLGDLFLALINAKCAGFGFAIACPVDGNLRGSQVSLRHPQGYAIIQALIARGVIGDFRAPDFLRFGFAPLYTRYVDIFDAVDRLAEIMVAGTWREERFQALAVVT